MHFIFDGGILTDTQITNIKIQANELSKYRFVELEEAIQLLGEDLGPRVANAVKVKQEGTCSYAEVAKTTNKNEMGAEG